MKGAVRKHYLILASLDRCFLLGILEYQNFFSMEGKVLQKAERNWESVCGV